MAWCTPLSPKDKADFAREAARTCFASQRQSELNKALPDALLDEYCQCAMDAYTERVTLEEVQEALRTKNPEFLITGPRLTKVLREAGDNCIKQTMKRWGYIK
jgi:hypothetical protein